MEGGDRGLISAAHNTGNHFEELRKTTEDLRTLGSPTEIWTKSLPNTVQKRYHLIQFVLSNWA
jgi:hypothetical protein